MGVNYYPLVNKVLNTFHLMDKMREWGYPQQAFVQPFITVAREPGSGGAPVAKAVATKLGFELIDEQLVEEVAKSTKKRKAIIQQVDEKSRTAIEDIVHSLFNQEYVSDIRYFNALARVILSYAFQGKVVILGRGANFMTPFAKGLHVNIIAPYQTRVQRAMDFEGFDEKKAKQVIHDTSKEREEFVKQYLNKDVTRRSVYDLTLNTEYFSIPQSRDIVVEAFYRKFSESVRYGHTWR